MINKINFLKFFDSCEPLNIDNMSFSIDSSYFNDQIEQWSREFWDLRENKKWPDMSFKNLFYYEIRDSLNKLQNYYSLNQEQFEIAEKSIKRQLLILFWRNYKDFLLALLPTESEKDEFIKKTIGDNKFDYTSNLASFLLYVIYCLLSSVSFSLRKKVFDYIKNDFETYLFDKISKKVKLENKKLLTNIEKITQSPLCKKVVMLLNRDRFNLLSMNTLTKEFKDYILNKYGFRLSSGTYMNNPFFTQFFYELFDKDSQLRGLYDKTTNIGAWQSVNPLILLQSIYENESQSARDKLFDYIFDIQISKEKYTKVVRKHNLWIDLCFDGYFRHLNQILARDIFKENIPMDMCVSYHPFINAKYEQISNGNKLFDNFFKEVFNKNSDEALSIVKNLDKPCKYKESKYSNWKDGKVRNLYLKYEIGFNEFKEFINIQCPNFDDDKFILERFYILFDFIKRHAKNYKDVVYAFMSEFVDSISYTYPKFEPKKRFSETREKNYKQLKKNCKLIGFDLNDSCKQDYITSLLDNSCATISERLMFPQLEMLGDKIFNFTINMLVYDDLTESKFEEFVKDSKSSKPCIPNFQIKWSTLRSSEVQHFIANTLNLSKLYISINPKKNQKYEYNRSEDEVVYWLNNDFIADSLEMIIGSYAKQEGIIEAIEFCKASIIKAFNTKHLYYMYTAERQSHFNGQEARFIESEFSDCLYDLLMVLTYKCDTKEKRAVLSEKRFMTNIELQDEIFKYFLNNGLKLTLDTYKDKIIKEIEGDKNDDKH